MHKTCWETKHIEAHLNVQLSKLLSPSATPSAANLTSRQFCEDFKFFFAESRNNSLGAINNKRLLFGVVKRNLTHNNGPFLDTPIWQVPMDDLSSSLHLFNFVNKVQGKPWMPRRAGILQKHCIKAVCMLNRSLGGKPFQRKTRRISVDSLCNFLVIIIKTIFYQGVHFTKKCSPMELCFATTITNKNSRITDYN